MVKSGKINEAQMIDNDGKVYAESNDIQRYSDNQCIVYYMKSRYLRLPEGNYDLLLKYDDGSDELLEGLITVTTKPVIRGFDTSVDYDNMGDYLYIAIRGYEIQPSELNYIINYKGKDYSLSYESNKKLSDGYAVKLKKNNWPSDLLADSQFTVNLSAKDGSKIFGELSASCWVYTRVYYFEYNANINKFETGFSSSLINKEYTAELFSDSSRTQKVAEAKGSTKDGFNLVEFTVPGTSTPFTVDNYTFYYADFSIDNEEYRRSCMTSYYSRYSDKGSYWSGTDFAFEATSGTLNQTYYYNNSIASTDTVIAKVTGITLDSEISVEVTRQEKSNGYTPLLCKIPLSHLPRGDYELTLKIGDKTARTRDIVIYPAGKFIITYSSAYWMDENTLRYNIQTPNASEKHGYSIDLYDADKEKITGISREKVVNGSRSIDFYIRNMDFEKAQRCYYFKVTDDDRKPGTAYEPDGETEYYGTPGRLTEVSDTICNFGYNETSTGVNGVYPRGFKFPGTMNFYVPYDTTVCATRTISANMLTKDGYYAFTQDLIDELPDKDALYDITFVDSEGNTGTINEVNVSADAGKQKPVTSISLTPTSARLIKGEKITLKVGYKPTDANSQTKITWSSANSEIASVDNTGLVTAVGVGTTQITAVTANGKKASCTISVSDLKISISKAELYLNQKENSSITFHVTGYNNVPVIKSLNKKVATVMVKANEADKREVTIHAVGAGETNIRVTADGITRDILVTVGMKYTVKSVSLNKTVLNMTTQSKPRSLTASVNPLEAQYYVQYEFQNNAEDVVSIAKDGFSEVRITPKKSGSAVITVVAKVDGKKCGSASCVVNVKEAFSTPEMEKMMKYFNGKLFAITNTDTKLSAVSINAMKDSSHAGMWSWDQPNTTLVADDKAPTQYFSATFHPDDVQKESFSTLIPVEVAKITGITCENKKIIKTKNSTWQDSFDLTYVGSEKVLESPRIKPSWVINGTETYVKCANQESKEIEGYIVSFNAVGGKDDQQYLQSLTMKASIDNGNTAQKDCFTMNKNVVIPKSDCISSLSISVNTIQPSEEKCIPNKKIVIPQNEEYGYKNICVNLNDVTKNSNKIKLIAIAQNAKGKIAEPQVTWSSSDSSVATISGTKGNGTITVKKAGKTIITVKSKDKGAAVSQILLQVLDKKPVISKTAFTLNSYMDSVFETRGFLEIFSQTGAKILSVTVSEGNVTSKDIEIAKYKDLVYLLSVTNQYQIPNNKPKVIKNLTLSIVTEDGLYTQPIKVTIENKKPTVKIMKQTQANVFYTRPETVTHIKADQTIAMIKPVDVSENVFKVEDSELNDTSAKLMIEAGSQKITKDNYNKLLKKNCTTCYASCRVYFAGYKESASQMINIKVPVVNKKQTFTTQDTVLYPGMTSSLVGFVKNKDKLDNSLCVSANSSKVNLSLSGNDIMLTNNGLTKTSKIAMTLSSAAWTQDVKINHNVVMKTGNPELKLAKSKMTLNTASDVQSGKAITAGIMVKGNSAVVEDIKVLAVGKNAELLKNEYLYVGFDKANQTIKVGLNKGNRGNIKQGTYQVNLKGKACEGTARLDTKEAILTLNITDKAPSVTLVASGSINLLNRVDSAIYYIPKLKNMQANLIEVNATGTNRQYFNYTVEDGKVKVQAKSGTAMYANKKYKSSLTLTFDNGRQLSVPIVIKPKQGKTVISKTCLTNTLYRKRAGTDLDCVATSNLIMKSQGTIQRFEPAPNKNWKYFDSTESAFSREASCSIKLNASTNGASSNGLVKPGTYKLPYYVYLKDGAVNVGPKKIIITVKVK